MNDRKEAHVLWHVREDDEYKENAKLIGVYASVEDCNQTIEKLKGKPGFIKHPNGFEISTYEVGKDHWIEGFGFD